LAFTLTFIVWLLLGLTVAAWVYWLLVSRAAHRLLRHSPQSSVSASPPVSVLKPLRGCDFEAYENFVSFCKQDYPVFELLFGVSDENDPAISVVERLKRDFPEVPIRLLIVQVEAPNVKCGLLAALAEKACFDMLAVSDSDMRVGPDYLQRITAPLAEPDCGLVTCPYRSVAPGGFATWEALYLDTSFLPGAIFAQYLGITLGLGATLAFRRCDLESIGGFEAFDDYLLDDHELARRLRQQGRRVELSDYVVENILGGTSFRDVWEREVRWARGIHAVRPVQYLGLMFTQLTPLAALLAALAHQPWALGVLAASLLLRWGVSYRVRRDLEQPGPGRGLVWLPLRDVMSATVWVVGLAGSRVVWRGRRLGLLAGGKLTPTARRPRETWLAEQRVSFLAGREDVFPVGAQTGELVVELEWQEWSQTFGLGEEA
jgi:ceramide glucosyltransferase